MKLRYTTCLILCLLLSVVGVAQNLRVDDIAKIKIVARGGGGFPDDVFIEVTNENHSWKSYLVRHNKAFSVDSTRRLIRNVPDSTVQELVDIINRPDRMPVVDHYALVGSELLSYVDSIGAKLKPHQREEFLKALQSKTILQKALLKVATPEEMDHAHFYSIAIVTKSGNSFEIHNYVFGYLDYSRWQRDKLYYYNPGIQSFFHYVRLKDKEAAGAKRRLYNDLAKEVYTSRLKTKFIWADFKEASPALFNLLNTTFKPIKLHKSNQELIGEFSSSRFPAYISFLASFKVTDFGAVSLLKKQEDTIVNIIKKVKFLAEHYKNQSAAKVIVSSESDGQHKPYFRFSMKSNNNNQSEWLVVNYTSLVLLNYSGQLKDPFSNKFEGIIPNNKNQFINKQAYLIYDFDGTLIGGNKEVGKSDLIFK